MSRTFWKLSLLCGLVWGCSSNQGSSTEIVVFVQSDLSVPTELDSVRVDISGASASSWLSFPLTASNESGKTTLPIQVSLVPANSNDLEFDVKATGFLGSSAMVSQETSSSCTVGQRRVLTLYLGRSCLNPTCGSGLTCSSASCIPVKVSPSDLPVYVPNQQAPTGGGSVGSGGSIAAGGTIPAGGVTGSGGIVNAGGGVVGAGGVVGTGGAGGSGGVVGSGGMIVTDGGGASTRGGGMTDGASIGSGGWASGSGGMTVETGGAVGTGGSGGVVGGGGAPGMGGVPGTGGAKQDAAPTQSDTAIACGGLGQACCVVATECTTAGLTCQFSAGGGGRTCEPVRDAGGACGGLGQLCCVGSTCTIAGLTCQFSAGGGARTCEAPIGGRG